MSNSQLSISSWANLFDKWLPQWPLNHVSTTASKQPNSFLNHLLHCSINPLLSSFHAHYLLFLPLNISFHPSKILHPEPPISLSPSPFFPLSPLHSPSFLSPPIFCWPLRGSVFGVCVCVRVCKTTAYNMSQPIKKKWEQELSVPETYVLLSDEGFYKAHSVLGE